MAVLLVGLSGRNGKVCCEKVILTAVIKRKGGNMIEKIKTWLKVGDKDAESLETRKDTVKILWRIIIGVKRRNLVNNLTEVKKHE